MANHPRNTGPMRSSLRCGAKTRSGKPCMSPAVSGKKRCRMHGGAPGSGAPIGSQNALKSGLFTREAIEERRALRDLIRSARQLAEDRVTVATGSPRLSKHYPHYFSGRFALCSAKKASAQLTSQLKGQVASD